MILRSMRESPVMAVVIAMTVKIRIEKEIDKKYIFTFVFHSDESNNLEDARKDTIARRITRATRRAPHGKPT